MQEPLLYRRAERPKRRRNQAREGQVAQASCAETFCPPAAKTGAAQPEGRTMLSKPSARRVERARRGRRAGAGGATVPSATSVRAGGSLSPSVSHTVVAWRCLEDRTLTGAPHRVRGRTLARGGRTACSGGLPSLVLALDAVRPVHHHEGPSSAARRRSGTHPRPARESCPAGELGRKGRGPGPNLSPQVPMTGDGPPS